MPGLLYLSGHSSLPSKVIVTAAKSKRAINPNLLLSNFFEFPMQLIIIEKENITCLKIKLHRCLAQLFNLLIRFNERTLPIFWDG